MAESADRTTVTMTTGMRASICRRCQALGARVGDLDPMNGGGEDVAHLVREQARVIIDQEQADHGTRASSQW